MYLITRSVLTDVLTEYEYFELLEVFIPRDNVHVVTGLTYGWDDVPVDDNSQFQVVLTSGLEGFGPGYPHLSLSGIGTFISNNGRWRRTKNILDVLAAIYDQTSNRKHPRLLNWHGLGRFNNHLESSRLRQLLGRMRSLWIFINSKNGKSMSLV